MWKMDEIVRNNILLSKCTVCYKTTDKIYQHHLLKVVICKACFEDFNRQSVETLVEECCFWCMKGRELLMCVQCAYKCCYDCINTNLGADYMNCLNEKNWLCFICDSDPIDHLQKEFVQLMNKSLKSNVEALTPEGTSSSIDISSPFVLVEEHDDFSKKPLKGQGSSSGVEDLDAILNKYERQIYASLRLANANVPSIIAEINSIKTEELSPVIRSLKKCLSAFSSDLTNLETRLNQAKSANSLESLNKLTSLLRILIQHHIFNRLSHPKARLRDDQPNSSGHISSQKISNNLGVVPPIESVNNNKKMHFIMDEEWRKDPKKMYFGLERVATDFSKDSNDDRGICTMKKRALEYFPQNETHNSPTKRQRLFNENPFDERKANRVRRSLTIPSWLSDFKIDREIDNTDFEEVEDEDGERMKQLETNDYEWTDYRFRDNTMPKRRGRPPKYPTGSLPDFEFNRFLSLEKRARGRPRKLFTLNDKQPRFYIQKLNGDALQSIDGSD